MKDKNEVNMKSCLIVILMFILTSCALSPVENEIPLEKILSSKNLKGNFSRVLVMNANREVAGLEFSGAINLSVGEKGLSYLRGGDFIIFDLEKGNQQFVLTHRDVFLFSSEHDLNLSRDFYFLEARSTPFSNKLEVKLATEKESLVKMERVIANYCPLYRKEISKRESLSK